MLHSFYPIAPDTDWLKRIVGLGAKCVQLRIKDVSDDDLRRQISEAIGFCDGHGCQLIVNDYWREAIDLCADFIHLGQEDLATADLAAIRRAGIRLGLSTHDRGELEVALEAAADYVALGPVYETKLKVMKWEPQGLDRVAKWKSLISCPLIAIGGITVERADGVYDAGADVIAVITDFITHEDPDGRIKQWLAIAR
jgi:thiamine-phosphate pyrophosphorylase